MGSWCDQGSGRTAGDSAIKPLAQRGRDEHPTSHDLLVPIMVHCVHETLADALLAIFSPEHLAHFAVSHMPLVAHPWEAPWHFPVLVQLGLSMLACVLLDYRLPSCRAIRADHAKCRKHGLCLHHVEAEPRREAE